MSASVDRRSEDIGIIPIIVAELKLRDIQRHVFGADPMEHADHATLEDRSETLDRTGVNGTGRPLASW